MPFVKKTSFPVREYRIHASGESIRRMMRSITVVTSRIARAAPGRSGAEWRGVERANLLSIIVPLAITITE